ncbi:MMPL family transporter [Ginsengibacter hankyongi]|uniref:MMPL family transporter n=1 Tax=Ginsengibacter hankyongi TaxID=2607284 RepID=A0A5J5IGY1_9BACT|nr:MMPL family transporter [Ginsengibacter hankyongi]KAA9039384.1 MMPL family transporter [Ginsengibacter hankyongi]
MWKRLAKFVLQNRLVLLILLFLCTGLMAFYASKIKLSYEFSKAIPTDNTKYQDYLSFKNKFGDDGNLLVIGVQTDHFFELKNFESYRALNNDLKKIPFVENVLSVVNAANLLKDTAFQKLNAIPVFDSTLNSQTQLDSSKKLLYTLPFYKSLLYNPKTNAFLTVVRLNKDVLNSPGRTKVINDIVKAADSYTSQTNIQTHISGLPLIRTEVADRIAHEMKWFIIGSLALSALILLIMFRSVSTTLLSLLVVIIGVIFSVGITYLFGYKITLLTALIPPLVVVIGIPNCIYFLNKYHSTFKRTGNKKQSLIDMVSKMGVVTLFCNLTAAIGFAVFALTNSAILKEFGQVAGLSIMLIFVISFILLPGALSYMPVPGRKQLNYLDVRFFTNLLLRIEAWVLHHKKIVYTITLVAVIFSVAGIFKLKTEGFIVDDLPKTDKIYTDLKFFEKNFNGVMPLEIIIDSKKRFGLAGTRILPVLTKMDSLSTYITSQKEMARPLSIAEGIKFVKQGFYDGDSAYYSIPDSYQAAFLGEYLKPNNDSGSKKNNLSNLLSSFIDTAKESTRMSINMADVGTKKLPVIIDGIRNKTNELFDSSKFKITFTGSTVTFLEGSTFIINGLKQSLLWAFLFITLCMLYLFKSLRILICSLIPNLIPLVITAGIMGWTGVRLKPSTVLIFSVALGIAIDVTIRFLVNYKQELPVNNFNIKKTVSETIKHTGLSILYTSLVLIAGFIIFCFSGFGGTQSLGWLTSITLLSATLTNLVLLPVLLLATGKKDI